MKEWQVYWFVKNLALFHTEGICEGDDDTCESAGDDNDSCESDDSCDDFDDSSSGSSSSGSSSSEGKQLFYYFVFIFDSHIFEIEF